MGEAYKPACHAGSDFGIAKGSLIVVQAVV